jgi:hypothetical protein
MEFSESQFLQDFERSFNLLMGDVGLTNPPLLGPARRCMAVAIFRSITVQILENEDREEGQ